MKEEGQSRAYLWLDTEYSSLDLDHAEVLQLSVLATDAGLNLLLPGDRGLNLFIRLDTGSKTSDWVRENLPGLIAKCRSPEAVTVEEAAKRLMEYIDHIFGPPDADIRRRPVLAGNSVHGDWFLMRRFFPALCERIHYRHLDVTTLKLQWLDWSCGGTFDKNNRDLVLENLPFPGDKLPAEPHDAYYDIHASIAELGFYRKNMLREKGDI